MRKMGSTLTGTSYRLFMAALFTKTTKASSAGDKTNSSISSGAFSMEKGTLPQRTLMDLEDILLSQTEKDTCPKTSIIRRTEAHRTPSSHPQ